MLDSIVFPNQYLEARIKKYCNVSGVVDVSCVIDTFAGYNASCGSWKSATELGDYDKQIASGRISVFFDRSRSDCTLLMDVVRWQ